MIQPEPAPTPSPDPPRNPADPTPTRMTRLREMQLIEAHGQGDPDAIAELLRSYQRRIYAVCMRMLGDRDDALDLTQDVLVKVMEGIDRYDGRAALSTWVIRIAMNACVSHLRRRKVRRAGSLDETGPSGAPLSAKVAGSREPAAGMGVELGERRGQLLRALEVLDPEVRAILILRDLQGLEYQEIAAVLEVPVGTVKSRLFRARSALRAACADEGLT